VARVKETLAYYAFAGEHWGRVRTTDVFDKRFLAPERAAKSRV
jgi:hypothetical protein